MRRMYMYFGLGVIAQFVLMSFINCDIEEGRLVLRDLFVVSLSFVLGIAGREFIMRFPMVASCVPFCPLIMAIIGL